MDAKVTKTEIDIGLIHEFFPAIRFLNAYHRYSLKGVEHIPAEGRLLVLVNHSFATYDIMMLGAAIYAYTGRLPRGLSDSQFYKTAFMSKFSHKVGMVEAGPENAEALLNEENILFLAPGGMREALRPSDEKYQIKWHNRLGFARLAIKTRTPVVLAACPKADELFTVSKSVLTKLMYKQFKLPFVFARGLGLSFLPRPVKLTHYLHEAIVPPVFEGEVPSEELVHEFQRQLVAEMEQHIEMHI